MNGNNRYLLDTTVFVDYLRGKLPARKIVFDTRASNIHAGYSIITEAELWIGIKGLRTETKHTLLLRPFTRYFVNVTIARRAGELRRLIGESLQGKKGQSPPELDDCLIAATAEYHNLTIYTRNEIHFKHFQSHAIDVTFYHI